MAETEVKKRGGVPRGLPISGVICLILGLILWQVIPNSFTEEQIADDVIIAAVPFILVFASIIITFMTIVWLASIRLSDNIAEKVYRPVEYVLIGGIVIGVLLMFQPWVFQLFRVGFFMLLLSTIGYILWSHVRPKVASEAEELAGTTESN